MKKIFCVILFAAAFSCFATFAQEQNSGSYYYVNIPIVTIFPYTKGYVVKYNTGTVVKELQTVYMPAEWFKPGADNKGSIVNLRYGTDQPSFTVVYKDGAFDHVKLYVKKDRKDPSWGYMPLGTNIDDRFDGLTDIPLKY